VAGYNVYRDGEKLNGVLVASTSFLDNTVKNNRQYTYTVQAVDGSGNTSDQSSPITVFVAPPGRRGR
jgi:hypothetical protein